MMVRVGGNAIAGVMDLQKHRAASHLGVAEQGHAAVIVRAEPVTLQVLRVNESRQHGGAVGVVDGPSETCIMSLDLATAPGAHADQAPAWTIAACSRPGTGVCCRPQTTAR